MIENFDLPFAEALKFDEALHSLSRAVGLKPDSAVAYFSLAIVYHNMNELVSAYDNYSKAIEFNPDMIDAYFNRGQVILLGEDPSDIKLNMALRDFYLFIYFCRANTHKKLPAPN